jgi:hypothetical protein
MERKLGSMPRETNSVVLINYISVKRCCAATLQDENYVGKLGNLVRAAKTGLSLLVRLVTSTWPSMAPTQHVSVKEPLNDLPASILDSYGALGIGHRLEHSLILEHGQSISTVLFWDRATTQMFHATTDQDAHSHD